MNQEASFTFTTPLNVNIVEIKGEEHLFVEGDISTNDIDLVDDIMTKACQESMQRQIIERNMKLDIEHEAFKGETHEEKEINKTKIPAGKLTDATVKDLGKNRYSTRVKGEINRHNNNYKKIKGNLLEGYLDAFSVAFLPTDITYDKKEGKSIRLLNDVKLLNIALTGNPCNTKAQMVDVVQKSMDALEDYKNLKKLDPSIEKQLIVKSLSESQKELVEDIVKYLENKSYSTFPKGSSQLNKTKNYKMTDKDDTQKPADGADAEGAESADAAKPADAGEGAESSDAEQKAMLKSVSEEMKALSEKYSAIEKENVDLKEAVGEISKNLAKITEALSQPVHKSPGIQLTDAENKAQAAADTKSVDPLNVF